MPTKNKLIIILASLLLFLGGFLGWDRVQATAPDRSADFKAGEILVKFRGSNEIQRIMVDFSLPIDSLLEQLKNRPEIEYAEPNYLLEITAFPNDPHYFQQAYLGAIAARDAWSKDLLVREQENITRRSVIAILDTGVDLDQPDLVDNIWSNQAEVPADGRDNDSNGYSDDISGWDFVDNDNDPNPTFDSGYNPDAVQHGTLVAGIAAAGGNNSQGIAGVSWFSQIMPLRVLDSHGSGDVFNVIRAIDYAIANGADVINMSFVGTNFSNSLFQAIQQAYDHGVVVVAAAGNTDPKINGVNMNLSPAYPVCFSGLAGQNLVIGVASVGNDFKKSAFSNYGGCVDLSAPGESFFSTQVYNPEVIGFGSYYNGFWSGTSLSAPLVSATFALIKGLRPKLSLQDLQDIVLGSTRDIDSYDPQFTNQLGRGELDIAQAVEAALGKRLPTAQGGQSNYLVAALGLGSFPQIKVLREDGTVFKEFFAYSPSFNGVINVAVGDVDGDGEDEVVTGAGFGGGPHVRIFNIEGQVRSQFFSGDKNFRSGINVAVGDVDGDGKAEIITGAGRGGEPVVNVFDYQGRLLNTFLAYDVNFLGGVHVATGDINGDGKAEIITGAGAGGGPHVRIFYANGTLRSQFFAYNQYFSGGVNVAAADVNGDGLAEVIASIEKNSLPTVRIFSYDGREISSFLAYEPQVLLGVNVAAADIDNDGMAEIVTGPGIGGNANLRAFDATGRLKFQFLAYPASYRGGLRPAVLNF